jgi:hypothetical protein
LFRKDPAAGGRVVLRRPDWGHLLETTVRWTDRIFGTVVYAGKAYKEFYVFTIRRMKMKKHVFFEAIPALALVFVATLCAALVFAGCDNGTDPGGGDPALSGAITISPSSGVTTDTQLTATYSGSESGVTYQWSKGGTAIPDASNTTYTAYEVGSYTVTVSAAGYQSKTSDAVTVTSGNEAELFDGDQRIDTGNNTLNGSLNYLAANAITGHEYKIVFGSDGSVSPMTLSYAGKRVSITLMGDGTNRTVRLSSSSKGSLFTIGDGLTLVLDNHITLQGHSSNNSSLIKVNSGGTVTMKGNTVISGNTLVAYSSPSFGAKLDP